MSISSPLGTCSRFRLNETEVLSCQTSESIAGTWHPDQSRVEWSWASLGVDPSLIDMAREEAALWDDWADTETGLDPSGLSDARRFSLSGWLNRYPNIAGVLDSTGITLDLRGRTVLDIGGSGKDMAYWLREQPARIDQVEVSPRSQFLCSARVRGGVHPDTGETIPIYYHTIPAENLPFDDASFDFVFSRSTIHHCQRPKVFSEIVRVMKPGAILLFVEPHLSKPVHWLMRTRRKLLKQDRGTDDPLRPTEMRILQGMLSGDYGKAAYYYSRSLLFFLNPKGRAEDWARVSRNFAMNVAFAGTKALA